MIYAQFYSDGHDLIELLGPARSRRGAPTPPDEAPQLRSAAIADRMRAMRLILLALVLCLVVPVSAGAQSRQFGSSLGQAPNANFGCETRPTFTEQSSNGDYFPRPSGTADCTWWQAGVYNSPNQNPTGAVPGDGTISNVAVRSGPNPAAIRFVIMRLFADTASGNRQCCFFVAETGVVQPRPNQTDNFSVNLPVENNRNPQNNLATQDYIGVSGVSGTGTLPLFTTGNNNTLTGYFNGAPVAGFFYPRFGSLPSDNFNGPGRREEAIPGFVVTMRSTWTPVGQALPPPPDGARNMPPGRTRQARIAQILGGDSLTARNGSVPIDIRCLLNGACQGEVLLRTRAGGASAGASAGRVVGRKRIRIRAGRRAKVRVKLNRAGRRIVRRKGRAHLVAVVKLGRSGTLRRNVTVR